MNVRIAAILPVIAIAAAISACSSTPANKPEEKQTCKMVPRQGTLLMTRVCYSAEPDTTDSAPKSD